MKLHFFSLFCLLIHNVSSFKQKDVQKLEFKKIFTKKYPKIDYPINEYDFINYHSQLNNYQLKYDVIENFSKQIDSKQIDSKQIDSKPLDDKRINIYRAIIDKIFYEKLKENKVKIATEIKSNSILQSTKFWLSLLGLIYIFISYFSNYKNIPCCD